METKTSQLYPKEINVSLSEEVLVVRALSVKKLKGIYSDLSKGIAEVMAGIREQKVEVEGVSEETVLAILNFAPRLLVLVDKSIDKPLGFCEDLPLGELTDVLRAFLEVNAFERIVKNLKAVSQMFPKVKSLVKI